MGNSLVSLSCSLWQYKLFVPITLIFNNRLVNYLVSVVYIIGHLMYQTLGIPIIMITNDDDVIV